MDAQSHVLDYKNLSFFFEISIFFDLCLSST